MAVESAASLPPPRDRRHELDALRILAVLALLLYHASRRSHGGCSG